MKLKYLAMLTVVFLIPGLGQQMAQAETIKTLSNLSFTTLVPNTFDQKNPQTTSVNLDKRISQLQATTETDATTESPSESIAPLIITTLGEIIKTAIATEGEVEQTRINAKKDIAIAQTNNQSNTTTVSNTTTPSDTPADSQPTSPETQTVNALPNNPPQVSPAGDPIAQKLAKWGWTKISCTPGVVFISGLSNDNVCVSPNIGIPAGNYQYNPNSHQLVQLNLPADSNK